MSEFYAFECGCKFKVLDNSGEFPKIDFSPKMENINLECSKTWELISDGNTKGCFQLESRLGKTKAKKLKPQNIEQLAALISIIRPGCLSAIRDEKSVTDHYIDKKNGLESIDYFHSSLETILDTTFGEMCYQEQAMSISQKIAGFNLQEADMLRKAIGKKNPEEMAKVKAKFIDGANEKKIVSDEQAIEIFNWIEKSQNYSFNKSHAVAYAINAYVSAYAKCHFPKIFFAAYLRFAKDKIDPQQEIKELVRNASEMDIDVSIPDIRNMNELFILKNNKIYFGITDIKGLGSSVYKKLELLTKDINISDISWPKMISKILININSTASKALMSCGALDYFKKDRTEMLFDYNIVSSLTIKEIDYYNEIIESQIEISGIESILNEMIINKKISKNRRPIILGLIDSVKKPPYSLVDKVDWLSDCENALLGVAITCSKLDSYDISMCNTNCKEFKTSLMSKDIIIAGEIAYINVTKTKTGKNPGLEMAFISIEDQFGMLDSIILFPEQWSKYKSHIFIDNILVFVGSRSKNKEGLVVEKCFAPAS